MLRYTQRQPRNYCVELEDATGHRSQPWNGLTHGVGPAFQPPVYSFRQGATITMPQKTATSQAWRATAPPNTPYARAKVSPMQVPKPASVKHLTCYFWAKNGTCKFSEEDCLYAHHNTGKVAQGPLQVELGRPAVAGKNATSARPIYQDWRGSAGSSLNESKSSPGTISDPGIQEQIRYITMKAKANAMADNSASMSVLPHKRRQSEAANPIDSLFRDGQRYPRSPSSASTDQLLENRMQALAKATETLSAMVERSMKAFDAAANVLHVDVESLVEVYHAIIPAGNNANHPAHVDKMSNALRHMTRVALDLSEMAYQNSNARISITRELDTVGLRHLAPAWHHLQI